MKKPITSADRRLAATQAAASSGAGLEEQRCHQTALQGGQFAGTSEGVIETAGPAQAPQQSLPAKTRRDPARVDAATDDDSSDGAQHCALVVCDHPELVC